jgi:hypothetical protein
MLRVDLEAGTLAVGLPLAAKSETNKSRGSNIDTNHKLQICSAFKGQVHFECATAADPVE